MRLATARHVRCCLAMAGAALLVACTGEAMLRRMTPPDADRRARDYLALFARGQVDSAIARLAPDLSNAEAREQLGKIGDLVANQPFDSVRVVGVQVTTMKGIRHANLSYELRSRSGLFLANVATIDTANTWFVEGVSVRTLDRSLEEQTRFSLAGKPLLHYFWLLVTVACAAVSLGAMVFLATRRQMPKRWWWVLASIVGVSPVDLNWTTGEVRVRTMSVQFGSAGFQRTGPVSPWIITFALPLGAILGLDRHRRWKSSPGGGEILSLPLARDEAERQAVPRDHRRGE